MAQNIPNMAGSKLVELRQRLFFVVFALIIYRLGTHVPVPGIDSQAIANLFDSSGGTLLGMFNLFSGGALMRASVFALGIMPYISASIIMQILTPVTPHLDQLRKEGEAGRRKINQYTRYATLGLAIIQSLSLAFAIRDMSFGGVSAVVIDGWGFIIVCCASLVTGTMFLVWLGEQITERGIGNGISLLIFAGIVAVVPSAVAQAVELVNNGTLSPLTLIFMLIISCIVVYAIVFVERGQRRLKVNYAARQQGRKMMQGGSSYIPLKVNMAGVIPPIFASSIILVPAGLSGLLGQTTGGRWLSNIATSLQIGQPIYVLIFFTLVVFFSFFYVSLTFNPTEMADNLKRQNAFLPGIRPGKSTERYIDTVVSRLTLAGAVYLGVVAIVPDMAIVRMGLPIPFGGTSLLIIVVVIMDMMTQIQSFLVSQQYESLMKKSALSGGDGDGKQPVRSRAGGSKRGGRRSTRRRK